jgi:hypothetical protein
MAIPIEKVVVIFFWNFFSWIPNIIAREECLVWFGIVDVGVVVCLLCGLGIEATFVGLTKARCEEVDGNVGEEDRHLLFFDRVVRLNASETVLGVPKCEGFLAGWYVALSIM